MIEYRHRHRVRYRECDPMGLLYHAHYVDHFEAARTEALREAGLPYSEIEDSGISMPVVELSIRYIRPAYYDDLIEVEVRIPDPPSVRITIDYTVRRIEPEPADSPITTGTVVLCFVDRERNRPVRAPARLLALFDPA